VRFQAEHHFAAPVPAVVTLLADPAFYLGLALPDLGRPEVLDQRHDRDQTTLRLRYEYQGNLDPIAQRLLGSDRLTWIQEVHIDVEAGFGSLHFEADQDPNRLHGDAEFALTPTANGSLRQLDGDLVVAVAGIGRMAERRIVPGVLHRLDVEAQALADQLRQP
jgi:hypothetical protein